jgi:signal transduction histidine kinase/DNA-binding response OmpR family regulator
MAADASTFNAAQVAVLADIARGTPLPQALDSIVRLIEGQAEGMLCSVLLLDEQRGVLHHGAAPHLPHGYITAINGSAIGPEAGSCGAAAYRHERIVIEDIATHPYWARYRHLALPHGLRACWSTPIFSPERSVLGTFAMYYHEQRAPTDQEIEWVNAATNLASIAIVRSRVETLLLHSENQARQLARLYAVASSVSETLVRVREPTQLYEVACRIAVEKRLAVLAWIGIYYEAEDRIEPVARFGSDQGYLDAIVLRLGDERFNRGPAARALLTRSVAISKDIAADPTFYWKDEALRRGLRSCAVFPFGLGGRRRAIFVIYRDAPDSFAEEVSVLSALTGNIAFAIESAETELERRRLLATVNERVKELTLLHGASRVLQMDRAIDDALLAELVALIPRAFQYPELCEAQIRWAHLEAHTAGWQDTPHRLAVALVAGVEDPTTGAIEIIYREPTPPEAYGPFLREELDLLRSLGDMVSSHFGRTQAEHAVREREERLRRNEAMLRIAGRVARLGGWSVDLPNDRVTLSDEACALYGIPQGATPTLREALALYTPEYHELIRRSIRACARDGTPFDIELELVAPRDRRSWVRAIGQAERSATGAITRLHGALQDISDRRRLEDQLRQAQKMEAVGRLASGVAHDFNNVLSVILSYSSFLIDNLRPGDAIRGDVEEIQRAGERAGQLTRQLLAFSRQQILQPRVIALDHILAGFETMLRRLIGDSVVLSLNASNSVGHIVADPGQIEQVIMNLVVNARDAMPTGGNLTIETDNIELDARSAVDHPGAAPGPYVVLSVSDSGIGMDAATRSRMFEPFFTTKDHGKGTGLGLSTVYGIVSQSGGHIAVDSEPGRGTRFRVYFPRVDAPVDVEIVDARPIALRGSETVLLVEDDAQVRKLAGSILRRAGYFVFEAQNAGEAVLVSERYSDRLHLLVTDVVMPRMGGRDLAERLVAARPDMRVLYLSGYLQEAVVQDGALAEGAAFLVKPITPDTLLWKVREVLDGPPLPGGAAAPTEPMPRRPARRSVPPNGDGRHILHVDDEESLVHLTARILTRLGYRISSFTQPAQALQAFRAQPASFDAVVTDVSMRGMTGFELVRNVWATRPDLPVVVTSGDFRPEDLRSAEQMKIRDLVIKPDTVEELGRVLHELFSRSHAGG